MMNVQRSYTSINPNAPAFVPEFTKPQPVTLDQLQRQLPLQRNLSFQPTYQSPDLKTCDEQMFNQQHMQCNSFHPSGQQCGHAHTAYEQHEQCVPKVNAVPFTLGSPKSNSTKSSSKSSHEGECEYASGMSDFEEQIEIPAQQVQLKKNQSCISKCSGETDQWKSKVRTELCKFWLRGLPCANRHTEQGCGFAHGEAELMPKSGLNEKYLTSVCKNFLEHPSKCTYGDRCIFQHPSMDPRKPQPIEAIFHENIKYTAMRLFQNIPNADVVYINAYALQTPRLSVFKQVAPNRGKNNNNNRH